MTTYEEHLAPIRERDKAWKSAMDIDGTCSSTAELLVKSQRDVPPLLAALDGVLALHKPRLATDLVALDVDPYWECSCGRLAPCPEAKAIRAAVKTALEGQG